MLKDKIIFLDLDGTLLDHTYKLPESAREALRLAKSNGHHLYINTGRSIGQVNDYIWEVGFQGFIGGNGNYIKSEGKELFHRPMPQAIVVKVYDYLVKHEIGFFQEGQECLYAHPRYLDELASLLKITPNQAQEKTDSIFPSTAYNQIGWHEKVNKISVVLTDKVDVESLRKLIEPELALGFFNLFGNQREFGDIYQEGTSKGKAVEFVMNYLDLPMSDSFCFGDSTNDIEMIKMAGTGVAMGNAIPKLKTVADLVTAPVNEDGLWKAFRQIGLI